MEAHDEYQYALYDEEEIVTAPLLAESRAEPSAPFEEGDVLTTSYAGLATTSELAVAPSAPSEEVLLGLDEDAKQSNDTNVVVNDESDLLAEEAAAEARQQGVDLIRGHLSTYLEHNPGATYVTWIATLHPENAQVSIDPRFLTPDNPWSAVFDEAMATMNGMAIHESSSDSSEYEDPLSQHRQNVDHLPTRGPRTFGGLIPLMVGFSMTIGAVLVALGLQIASTIVYGLAILCYQLCRLLPKLSPYTVILYALPVFLLTLFRALDLLMLLMDTGLVEILAALAYVICAPLALSHPVGAFYHQQTRRLPHYVRWACRKPLGGFQPPRAACTGMPPSTGGCMFCGRSETAAADDHSHSSSPAAYYSFENATGFGQDEGSVGGILKR